MDESAGGFDDAAYAAITGQAPAAPKKKGVIRKAATPPAPPPVQTDVEPQYEGPAAPREAKMGDNGGPAFGTIGDYGLTGHAAVKLRHIVASIERLEKEKRELAAEIKDVKAEAKSMGYDTKAISKAIRLRAMDRQKREEEEMILDTYMIALGEAEERI